MSRSYKKHPYYTDGHRRTTKETKQIANRCVRRRNKRIVFGYLYRESNYQDILCLDGMAYKKFFCSWDIHDYINRWTKAEAIHQWEHPHWYYFEHTDTWRSDWDDFKTREEMEQYWAKYYRRK
jgi:hypothetical protein